MRVCLLASGSKGNSLYIEGGGSKILVDAGLSAVELVRRLAAVGVEAHDLDAVLISHEHTDHIRGAGTLARKFGIPVYATHGTRKGAEKEFKKAIVKEFEAGCAFALKDLLVDTFSITHDAADPVGFVVECREGKVGFATDLGIATRLVADKLQGCRALVLESNHDEEMLQNGPYPWHLKQRIKSRHGHLSNNDSATLLSEIIHSELEGVFLAHLSEVNNDPAVAREVTENLLNDQNLCAPRLIVGCQQRVSEVLTL